MLPGTSDTGGGGGGRGAGAAKWMVIFTVDNLHFRFSIYTVRIIAIKIVKLNYQRRRFLKNYLLYENDQNKTAR
jgi:hypothetical protein